jgi:replicative DNA helicase
VFFTGEAGIPMARLGSNGEAVPVEDLFLSSLLYSDPGYAHLHEVNGTLPIEAFTRPGAKAIAQGLKDLLEEQPDPSAFEDHPLLTILERMDQETDRPVAEKYNKELLSSVDNNSGSFIDACASVLRAYALGLRMIEQGKALVDRGRQILTAEGGLIAADDALQSLREVREEFEPPPPDPREKIKRAFSKETGEVVPLGDRFSRVGELIGGGPHRGSLLVIGGATSQGKSALSLCFALAAATRGSRCLFWGLEMSTEETMQRAVSAISAIPLWRILKERLNSDEERKLEVIKEKVAQLPIEWRDTSDRRMRRASDLTGELERLSRRGEPVSFAVVDYLQLLVHERGTSKETRATRVGESARQLKMAAGTCNCAVLTPSQLSRASGHEDKPKLNHLRESGDIENHSSIVALLSYYDAESAMKDRADLRLELAKNRQGKKGEVRLDWHKDVFSFWESNVE